ncbi:MAG: Holliday junction resolvase RuvX [Candidatus Puniceispirillum sp.]|nr:Holliday junction resolvase RuvX [Candidatus Puniceispirillum sp.]
MTRLEEELLASFEKARLFCEGRQKSSRLVGLDVGTKTLGVAISDARWQLSTPLKTLARGSFGVLVSELSNLLSAYEVAAFVVGVPVNMDGSFGARAQASLSFGQNLGKALMLPVFYQDERLSTAAATQVMLDAGVPSRRHKEKIDAVAASVIMQTFLDRLRVED